MPRRSLSNRAKETNIKAIETKKSLKTTTFNEKAKKRRSLSLGPDARLMIEKLHDNLINEADDVKENGNQQAWSKGNGAINE